MIARLSFLLLIPTIAAAQPAPSSDGVWPLSAASVGGSTTITMDDDVGVCVGGGPDSCYRLDTNQTGGDTATISIVPGGTLIVGPEDDIAGGTNYNITNEGTDNRICLVNNDATADEAVCLSITDSNAHATLETFDSGVTLFLDTNGGTIQSKDQHVFAAGMFMTGGVFQVGDEDNIEIGSGDDLVINSDGTEADFAGATNFESGAVTVETTSGIRFDDNRELWMGFSSGDFSMRHSDNQTPDGIVMTLGTENNALVISDDGADAFDHAHALASSPTPSIYLHDGTDSTTNYLGFRHNTDAQFETKSGDFAFLGSDIPDADAAKTGVRTVSATAEFAADPGDASVTLSSLIPDGAFVVGVTSEVVTLGTNCASYDVGTSGDDDVFAAGIALADGTQSTNADATAQYSTVSVQPSVGATDVIVTANTANCFDLDVAVIVHYVDTGFGL